MNLLIDFYKGLDTLNLIIFWGIIIVIILVIILIIIIICKNKKLKNIEKNNNDNQTFGELPIKKETIDILPTSETKQEEKSLEVLLPEENKISEEHINKLSNIEEQQTLFPENNISKEKQENNMFPKIDTNSINEMSQITNEKKSTSPIEIPSKPYQRNVLREMSLSQTSPIGINRPIPKEDKKMLMEKDLEDALNEEEINTNQLETNYSKTNEFNQVDNQIKKDLYNIQNESSRKTEIQLEPLPTTDTTNKEEYKTTRGFDENYSLSNHELKEMESEKNRLSRDKELEAMEYFKNISVKNEEAPNTNAIDLLINNATIENSQNKSAQENYLEEVSRKLSNAETPDEIERTMYEIQQEEDAIISYKELMEKKDSIQTIDEEDAVISIEELMNKQSQNQEEYQDKSKLYNISEDEENDDFLKELKQFRHDL